MSEQGKLSVKELKLMEEIWKVLETHGQDLNIIEITGCLEAIKFRCFDDFNLLINQKSPENPDIEIIG